MPKVIPLVSDLVVGICSNPVYADGSVFVAAESIARDRVVLWEFPIDLTRSSIGIARFVEKFEGVQTPTSGIRAQWPRILLWSRDRYIVALEHGEGQVAQFKRTPGSALSFVLRVDTSRAGMWPVAVSPALQQVAVMSPSDPSSQGLMGHLDDAWRRYEDLWGSTYEVGLQGRLHWAWRAGLGGMGGIKAEVVLYRVCHAGVREDRSDERVLVSRGPAENGQVVAIDQPVSFPSACLLPDGRMYVHGNGPRGEYRAAIVDFDAVDDDDSGGDEMPTTVTILDGWSGEWVRGTRYAAAVITEGAKRVDVWLETDDGLRVGGVSESTLLSNLHTFAVTYDGPGPLWLRARAFGAGTESNSSGARRRQVLVKEPDVVGAAVRIDPSEWAPLHADVDAARRTLMDGVDAAFDLKRMQSEYVDARQVGRPPDAARRFVIDQAIARGSHA